VTRASGGHKNFQRFMRRLKDDLRGARQSLSQICPAILIQMGDAKTQMDDAKARVAWVN
jgi:hypothetical protein